MTTLSRADPNTIQDKVLVGYQGWFTCAGDGRPLDPAHHGWLHWFNQPIPSGGRPNVDLWPDTSEYDPSELYPAPGLTTSSGEPVHLFSSRHPKTVQRHFRWMARHDIDGAFLQRFAGQCELKPGNIAIRDLRDEIGERVREAAEAEGRVFAIMYDVSGVAPDKLQNILEQDWTHLLRDQHLLDSLSYLRERGRPVVALWGFGLNGRNHTPELVRAITAFFRSFTPGGVYLVAGTPGHWRTSTSDADRNPEFVQVWTDCFDAISPWTVGRFGNEDEADQWGQGRLKADADYLSNLAAQGGRKVDYIPVVLPGGSGFNLSEGKWRMNDMKRNGGRFLWRQLRNAQLAGVRTIYGAMWDEYDEGTVFMPVVSSKSQLPVHPSFRFVALDADGLDLPSDWYMRVLGLAAEAFHGERTLSDAFPQEELQDYWCSRPRYETTGAGKGRARPADVDAVTQAVGGLQVSEGSTGHGKQTDVGTVTRASEWGAPGGGGYVQSDAPPPYSLEDKPAQPQSSAYMTAPPVQRDTRPSPGLHSSLLVGGAAAAGLAAHALSASATSAQGPAPPVNRSSRPPPLPAASRPHRTASEMGTSVTSPVSHGGPPFPHAGYDTMGGLQGFEHGRVASIGHSGMGYAEYAGEHGRQRRRRRRRSGSGSSNGSRSSSGSRREAASPMRSGYGGHPAEHGRGRGHSPSFGRQPTSYYAAGPPSQPYSPPAGPPPVMSSPQGMGFSSPGAGMYDSGGRGGYAPPPMPPPSLPGLGADMYSGGRGMSPQSPPAGGYAPPPMSPPPSGYSGGPGYAPGPGQGREYTNGPGYGQGYAPGPQGGYGGGQPAGGYGYGPGPQGYGYTAHPSSYGPGAGGGYGDNNNNNNSNSGGGGGGGGGRIQGGIASALQAVEGVAGPQTRHKLEKTVKSLTNTGSSLFNKFKQ